MILWWDQRSFYAGVCWGGSSTDRDRKRLNKLVRSLSSVLDQPLDFIEVVGERRMLAELTSIVDSSSHRLHPTVEALSSSVSGRLRHPLCSTWTLTFYSLVCFLQISCFFLSIFFSTLCIFVLFLFLSLPRSCCCNKWVSPLWVHESACHCQCCVHHFEYN